MNKWIVILKEWVAAHSGLLLSEQQMESGVQEIRRLMDSLNLSETEYLNALQAGDDKLIKSTIDILTVQESYFFRDSPLFSYLKNELLPQLINKKRMKQTLSLRIWSAGCARGEEIYSIAILLNELLPDINRWTIELAATDISYSALEKGISGVFNESRLRATEDKLREKYFIKRDSLYYLNEEIKNRVSFSYFNLRKPGKLFKSFDLIFCRNVFIYFSKSHVENILQFFYEHLVEGGILFLGPADLVTHCQHHFSVQMTQGVYRLKKITQIKEQPKKAGLAMAKIEKETLSYKARSQESTHSLQLIQELLTNTHYKEALNKIDNLFLKGETALLYRCQAQALIALGDINAAQVSLEKSIRIDPLDAMSHFLLGLVEVDQKENKNALISFQKALYIKPLFPEAAYHLGLLHLQMKQNEQGIKWLNQALRSASTQDDDELIFYTNEPKTHLINAIQASISYYQGQHDE
ncbi:CheR family methyltransferase [Legionella genomosp. 1]|uniref:CheR family methyltransferase n=1 Tax=Legionella genomosp. 1 TaxID=1093625 RepID=UPI0013EF7294|nr:CheR family methyltransferase [Legionella genomosp. 1]